MTGKITVTPEGRPDIWLPDRDSLKAWITANAPARIHNFIGVGSMMIGADHDKEDVLADIDRADRLAIMTGDSRRQNMNHALAVIFPADDVRPERLEVYDIGAVTEEDLAPDG